MPVHLPQRLFANLSRTQVMLSMAFFATVPLWFPILDITARLFGSSVLDPERGYILMSVMSLTAMFTALTMLFVCLIRTAYAHLGTRLVRIGALAYAIGYLLLVATPAIAPSVPDLLKNAMGALLGFGGAIVCLAWSLRLRWDDCRDSLRAILIYLAAGWVLNGVLYLIANPLLARTIPCAIACVSAAGTALTWQRDGTDTSQSAGDPSSERDSAPAQAHVNWWDIFGRLDTSALSTDDDYAAPASRIVFLVITPLLVLLLAIANIANATVVVDTTSHTLASTSIVSFGLALLCAIPLTFVKSGRALVNTAFHMYLPLIALIVMAVAAYSNDALHFTLLHEGINLWCVLYAICMFSLLLSMPGRMKSLCLPCASFLILTLNLTTLLMATPMQESASSSSLAILSFACLVGAVVLLATQPSSRLWYVMLDLIPPESATAQQITPEPSITERTAAIARAYGLTDREAEVLSYLIRGHGAAYVADALGVSESTIRTHRGNIYRKLGVSSREELIAFVDTASEQAK